MAFKSSINTGLPNIPDPADPADFAEFARIYNAIRNTAIALDAYTGALAAEPQFYSQTPAATTLLVQNMQRVYCKFDTLTAYGKTVYLYQSGGILTAGLSTATDPTKPIRGWCNTPSGVAAGAYGEVMLGGLCSAIGGMTPGTTYFAGNTAGTIANGPGTYSQKVGFAISASQIFMRPEL